MECQPPLECFQRVLSQIRAGLNVDDGFIFEFKDNSLESIFFLSDFGNIRDSLLHFDDSGSVNSSNANDRGETSTGNTTDNRNQNPQPASHGSSPKISGDAGVMG